MPENYAPHMSRNELAFFSRFIPDRGICLEFDSGGSTQFF